MPKSNDPRVQSALQRRQAQSVKKNKPVNKSSQTATQRSAPMGPGAWAAIATVVVIAVVLAILLVSLTNNTKSTTSTTVSGQGIKPASPSLVSAVTNVPASIYNQVGTGSGSVDQPPTKIKSSYLSLDGKPEIIYIGAEFCPYCAAERWVLITALARFGTFSNLYTAFSSSSDVYPSTPTFTFLHASYTSQYLVFDSKENQDENHNLLQKLNSTESSLWSAYGQNAYPFIDIAGKWQVGVEYIPSILSNLTQNQVAADLSDPTSPVTKAIIGGANYLTAAICNVTSNQPTNVCKSPGVLQADTALGIS
jgi:thiol-disulfide isomerase/thioredoxin